MPIEDYSNTFAKKQEEARNRAVERRRKEREKERKSIHDGESEIASTADQINEIMLDIIKKKTG